MPGARLLTGPSMRRSKSRASVDARGRAAMISVVGYDAASVAEGHHCRREVEAPKTKTQCSSGPLAGNGSTDHPGASRLKSERINAHRMIPRLRRSAAMGASGGRGRNTTVLGLNVVVRRPFFLDVKPRPCSGLDHAAHGAGGVRRRLLLVDDDPAVLDGLSLICVVVLRLAAPASKPCGSTTRT